MTAEEGEKNFPRDEEPFLDDEKIGRLCTLCRRLGGSVHSLRCYCRMNMSAFMACLPMWLITCSCHRQLG